MVSRRAVESYSATSDLAATSFSRLLQNAASHKPTRRKPVIRINQSAFLILPSRRLEI